MADVVVGGAVDVGVVTRVVVGGAVGVGVVTGVVVGASGASVSGDSVFTVMGLECTNTRVDGYITPFFGLPTETEKDSLQLGKDRDRTPLAKLPL